MDLALVWHEIKDIIQLASATNAPRYREIKQSLLRLECSSNPIIAQSTAEPRQRLCTHAHEAAWILYICTSIRYLWPPGRTLEAMLPAMLVPARATLLALSRSFSRPSFSSWLPLPSDSEASPIDGFTPRWLATSMEAASAGKKTRKSFKLMRCVCA